MLIINATTACSKHQAMHTVMGSYLCVQIPKCKHVTSHSIAGKARINLTFRQLKPAWADKAPCCKCGHRAVMKASLPSSAATEQRYYYTCDNTKGPGCGFFLRAQTVLS